MVSQVVEGAPFIVQATGRFSPDDVTVVWEDIRRRTNPEIEAAIEKTWRDKQDEATRFNRLLYNSVLGRLSGAAIDDQRLVLRLGETDYRDFVGTNLFNAGLVRVYGEPFLANALGTSATIVTSDGYILYGRRNDRVIYHAGYLHTFGGTLEPADRLPDRTYDLFGAIRRELHEETHLKDEEIVDLVCTGLVRDVDTLQPELLFDAHVGLTRNEVLSRFDPDTDEEHTAIEACHDLPEAIVPFIQRSQPVVPVAVAAMMLHGAANWGRDWYENTSYVLFGELPPLETGRRPHPL
ncbi:MAG: NUDIX hydrolase [Phycisphaerae bacterium]